MLIFRVYPQPFKGHRLSDCDTGWGLSLENPKLIAKQTSTAAVFAYWQTGRQFLPVIASCEDSTRLDHFPSGLSLPVNRLLSGTSDIFSIR